MIKIFKSYIFRIYPNKNQEILIDKTFGCVRFIYNKLLEERISIYQKYKNNKEELKKQKLSTPARFKKEYNWLKEVDSLALANAQINLQAAFNNFFRSTFFNFPKYKSRHKSKKTYTTNNVNNSIRIENNKIKLPKLGFVDIVLHRQIPNSHVIKSCTISKTSSEKYYISIMVESDEQLKEKEINLEFVLGLDMDMKNLYTDSQGVRAEYPQYYRKILIKLQKEQRKLSKRKKGSKNREKQKRKVAKLHEKVANQRKDFLHKKSKELADKYDVVIIEDLDMKEMSQKLNLGKSILDNGWGMFTIFLRYKLNNQGKQLIKIDKWFPSSKKCNECGEIYDSLQLSEREWVCKYCGSILDRDYNAAKNIRDEGIRMLELAV